MLEGNTIGLDAAGDAFDNDVGIVVGVHAENTRIGGTAPGARNVIAGHGNPLSFTSFGLLIGQDSASTTVQGNYIGLAADGTTAKPNTIGIRVDKTAGAQIGGTAPGAGNVISANLRSGIELNGGTSTGVIVEGNLIGTDATGTADRGNGQDGIFLSHALGSRVGGTAAGARNVISGNGFSGVQVGLVAGSSVIEGNMIGTAVDGVTALGNDRYGVEATLVDGPLTVGGTDPGAGNTIAFNSRDGVAVLGGTGVSVLGNAIRSNGGGDPTQLGIDLADDGVTANDPGDGDDATHPNRLQNFPVLGAALTDGSSTLVSGTIDSTPRASLRVELFSSAGCSSSGTGQGEAFLGATTVTAGAGATAFAATVGATQAGHAITATATDLTTGDTSEFSSCVFAAAPPPPPPPPPLTGASPPPVLPSPRTRPSSASCAPA